jgi:ribonuclease HI
MTRVAADASVRGQAAAWGAVVRREDGTEWRLRGRLQAGDPCDAELQALHRALRATRRDEQVEVVVDSLWVVRWLEGAAVPPRRLASAVRVVRGMLRRRQAVLRWTPAHRPEEDPLHRLADALARAVYGTTTNGGAP